MTDDPLFRDRLPAAAASQCALVLAEAVECELGTLEWVTRKAGSRAPLYERERHEEAARRLVWHCRDLNVQPRGFGGRELPLLAYWLQQSWWLEPLDSLIKGVKAP